MVDFTPELDLYEREAARRMSAFDAHAARRELEAHLYASYEARLELGAGPEAARLQALEALGDPLRIARQEPRDLRDVALRVAPSLFLLAFVLQVFATKHPSVWFHDISSLRPDVRFAGPAVLAILAAAFGSRRRDAYHLRPLAEGSVMALAGLPFLMLLGGREIEREPFITLALWSIGTAVLAHVAAVRLAPMIAQGAEPKGAFWARLLGWPLGMAIVGHTNSAGLLPWAWPLAGVALLFGMIGRRKIDLPVAAATTLLGLLANRRLEFLLSGQMELTGLFSAVFVVDLLTKLAMIVILQALALRFWSLLRSSSPATVGGATR